MTSKTGARLIAAAVAVASSVGSGPAWAHETASGEAEAEAALRSTPFATEKYGSGVVSGEASLEEDNGQLEVKAAVAGLTPGTTHVGHIHFGDAAAPCTRLSPGAIIHNLEPITVDREGEGRSVTRIGVTAADSLAAVGDCEWWVAFHEGPANTSPQSPAVAVGPVLVE